MTPAARIEAAIRVLDQILSGTAPEKTLTNWARRSRFAGSGDRAAVRDHVYGALRCRQSFSALGGAMTGRGLMLGMMRASGQDVDQVFTGEGHAPARLAGDERVPGMVPGDCVDLPDWLFARFQASLGGPEARAQALLLRERAPVVLRVNLRKVALADIAARLAAEGIAVTPNPAAETALTVTGGARRLAQSGCYRDGLVELQDASSQAAMAQVDVPAGARVLDYCAGGGGKVLALAARAEARWFAHDADPGRMSDLPARAARAGADVTCLSTAQLATAGPFDLILTDVPCSGSGTWRRAPMVKWDLTPGALADLTDLQLQIARQALARLRPGGRLIYTTCSVLAEENEQVIDRLLAAGPGLTCLSQHRWPVSPDHDGFFCARLAG